MHRATSSSDQASWRDLPLLSQGPASCASLPWGFAGVNLYFYPCETHLKPFRLQTPGLGLPF